MAVGKDGEDVRVKLGQCKQWPIYSTLWPAGPLLRSRPEAASDVISGRFVRLVVLDKWISVCKLFCSSRIHRSREIRPEAIGCCISTLGRRGGILMSV